MPKFSTVSTLRLNTCHHDLQRLFNEVIKHYDCMIIEGSRSDADQRKYFAEGKSKADGVTKKSKHQVDRENPFSRAIDVMPCPLKWDDREKIHHFAGFVKATAIALGIKIVWGNDWDNDNDFRDNTLNDLPHYELC